MNSKRVALLVLAAIVIAIISLGAGFGIGSAVFKSTDAPTTSAPSWLLPYDGAASSIFSYLTSANGAGVGIAYQWLANLSDSFGNRKYDRLRNATEYMINTLRAQGFDNVHTESAPIANWIRGVEVATLITPRIYPMAILGLGFSVPTPPEGITAPVYVVDTFDELDEAGKAGKVNGTILVYNEKWFGSYGPTVSYRYGASRASYYGAVALLVRSVTPFSIYTPHTGAGASQQSPYVYNNKTIQPIPQASITVEDAMMLRRLQDNGQQLTIFLNMTSYLNGTIPADNIIFELTGSEFPNEFIVLSGHFDSWDVGQGAMDDGGGCAVAWNTLMTLKNLGLQPRRSVRAIFWVGEEMDGGGVITYYAQHKNSTEKWIFAFESDEGAFMPSGPANNTFLEVDGNATAVQRLQDIAETTLAANGVLFSIRTVPGAGGEVAGWADLGAVTADYINEEKFNGYYFYFHHTNADTMTVLKKEDLDYVTAIMTTYTHIIANMDKQLSVP